MKQVALTVFGCGVYTTLVAAIDVVVGVDAISLPGGTATIVLGIVLLVIAEAIDSRGEP